jgi:NTE family protein
MRQDFRAVPFFSDLPDEALAEIEKQVQRVHYPKGAQVFAEGDFGDRMYILESGQVKVFSGSDGHEKIFNYLNPGNFFGETALLTGEPRNASVSVVLDSDLIVLTQSALDALIEQYPTIAVEMSRELGRRLSQQQHGTVQLEEYNLVAVVGPRALPLARELAALTGEEIFLFDLGGLDNQTVDQAALAQAGVLFARHGGRLTEENLSQRLSALVQEYYWLLLSIPEAPSPVTRKAIELADATVHFSDTAEPWLAEAAGANYWRVANGDRLVGRVARRMSHRQVGLALSSGSARGLAHIGVLKVFEQEHIPVDMIAATSMGAIIGALYCSGCDIPYIMPVAEMMQRQTNFLTGFSMWDFGLPPRSGLLRGHKTLEYLRRILDNRHFEDLATPLNIVAADVVTGEEVVFDHGPLAEAIRASISIIGVFEPAHYDGRYLVDGGAVNPVPTSVLESKGLDVVVASSVIPSLRERVHRKQQLQSGRAPNVFNIVMGAMEIMESEIIKTHLRPMDVVIQPDVVRFTTLDYGKVHEIVTAGEVAARAQLGRIRQLLAPRPRPRPGN